MTQSGVPHVVVIGGGFGGLTLAKELGDAPVRVTVVDREIHHLFQPLLYQVAMAGLSPAEIAAPIRSVVAKNRNTRVLMAEVARVDVGRRHVVLDKGELAYDYVVVATGARTSYFGHDEWSRFAPGLKSIEDAIEIRRRVLLAFERAERESDPLRQRELLTFVVIGGGPTGVELAGAISELSRHVLATDFRAVDPSATRVVLLEAGTRILAAFTDDLSRRAVEQLTELCVEVRTGKMVTGIDEHGVLLGDERVQAATVLWAAGVRATSLPATLGAELDRTGRVVVGSDCSIAGHPEVFAIGDCAAFTAEDGAVLPGVSPVAMQQARFVARQILRTVDVRPREVFRYVDKGTMATIGRSRAVAQAGKMRLSGLLAWVAWLVVHIWYLIGFRSRLVVMLTWMWSYVTYKRGARLITGPGECAPQLPPPSRA